MIRSGNTSAATHEMRHSRGKALNDTYPELLDHYKLESTLINSGESHKNGVAWQGLLPAQGPIDQALMLPGSRDYDTVDDYTGFVVKWWIGATGW